MIDKLIETVGLINCWVEAWGENNVAVSFSGGIDSLVLLHIVRTYYPNIRGVFSNTGLEYPDIVNLVKATPNVDIVRPIMPFHKVINKYGWPVISKTVSRFVSDCQNATEKNKATVNLRLTGITRAGNVCKSKMLSKKWRHLISAPFKISDKCCHYLKKQPLENYYKTRNIRPMVGVMKEESIRRKQLITRFGCNMYNQKNPISYPLANWTTKDIWSYIHEHNLEYAKVYDKGEQRTGCVFCMFGIMFDKERFIRLKRNSPKQYDYVINKLGADKVLDYLEIPY